MDDARIDRLESRAAIETLMANYAQGFDTRDLEMFLAIWADDCALIAPAPVGTVSGHAALADLVENQLWRAWQWSMHIMTNCVVRFEEAHPNSAEASSNVCCIGQDADGIGQTLVASYSDIFRRHSGIWKLASRQVIMRWQGATDMLIGKVAPKIL